MNVRAHSTILCAPLQPRSRCGCAVCSIIPRHLNVPQAVLDLRPRRVPGRIASAVLAVLAATCSSPTKPGPVVELSVQSVSPAAGPAAGGTELTIRGSGFAAGSAVTIGGRAAADVSVRGAETITAKTPASTTAGVVDIAVTVNGRTGTLAGGFRYEVVSNTAPVIRSIVAQGKRLRQPANFGDYGEILTLTTVVEDAQMNPALLTYQWHAGCGGTFTGTGRQVEWQTPATGANATTCTVEVIVSDGPRVVTGSLPVRLHNSAVEVRAIVLFFLEKFAESSLPAELTVNEFSNSCPGKAEELKDVANNRATRTINSHNYGTPAVTVAFGAMCRNKTADACAITSVEWNSTVNATGATEIAKGTSIITGVYRDSRWWLCDSLYDGTSSLGLHFMH